MINYSDYINAYLDVVSENPQDYQGEDERKLKIICDKLKDAVDELNKYWNE